MSGNQVRQSTFSLDKLLSNSSDTKYSHLPRCTGRFLYRIAVRVNTACFIVHVRLIAAHVGNFAQFAFDGGNLLARDRPYEHSMLCEAAQMVQHKEMTAHREYRISPGRNPNHSFLFVQYTTESGVLLGLARCESTMYTITATIPYIIESKLF